MSAGALRFSHCRYKHRTDAFYPNRRRADAWEFPLTREDLLPTKLEGRKRRTDGSNATCEKVARSGGCGPSSARPSIPRRPPKIISATTVRGGFASRRTNEPAALARFLKIGRNARQGSVRLLKQGRPCSRARSGDAAKTRRFRSTPSRACLGVENSAHGWLSGGPKQGATSSKLETIQPFRRRTDENSLFSHSPSKTAKQNAIREFATRKTPDLKAD